MIFGAQRPSGCHWEPHQDVGDGAHSLVWPGDIDFGADQLYEMALEPCGHPDAVAIVRNE